MQPLPILKHIRSEGHLNLPKAFRSAIVDTMKNGSAKIMTIEGEKFLCPGDWLLEVRGGWAVMSNEMHKAIFPPVYAGAPAEKLTA